MAAPKSKKAPKSTTKKKVKINNKPPFFEFSRRDYSAVAKSYHHEIQHLTTDLIEINLRIQKASALCKQQLNFRKVKDGSHLKDPHWLVNFEETQYHIENFSFRAAAYRDKLAQFVNQALRLGYDESQAGLIRIMSKNRIYKEAHLDTELKKFELDPGMKEIMSLRIKLSHRTYYDSTFYNPFFLPRDPKPPTDVRKRIDMWAKNLDQEVKKTDRFTKTAIDMNNKIMTKVNAYWRKYKRR